MPLLAQEVLGRYALPVLADYVAISGLAAQAQVGFIDRASMGIDCSLGNAVAAPLRSAACVLYGVCSASQVGLCTHLLYSRLTTHTSSEVGRV